MGTMLDAISLLSLYGMAKTVEEGCDWIRDERVGVDCLLEWV